MSEQARDRSEVITLHDLELMLVRLEAKLDSAIRWGKANGSELKAQGERLRTVEDAIQGVGGADDLKDTIDFLKTMRAQRKLLTAAFFCFFGIVQVAVAAAFQHWFSKK